MKSCWTWDVLCSNIVTLSYAKVTIVWWCYDSKYQHFLNPSSRDSRWRQSHCRHGHRVEDMPGSESCSTQFWNQNFGAKFGQEVKTSPLIFNVFFCIIWVGLGLEMTRRFISTNDWLEAKVGQVTTRPWWSEIQKERIVFQPSIFRGYDGLC